MNRVLLTAFEPFGQFQINSSKELLERFRGVEIGGAEIVTRELPAVYDRAIEEAVDAIRTTEPDVVIGLGQSGRDRISIERMAINVKNGKNPDNEGNFPENELISHEGADAYFSSLPLQTIVEELKANGIPARISNSAGTYVCNNLMYGVLQHLEGSDRDCLAGFVHVPCLPRQVVDLDDPSWPLDFTEKGVLTVIETVVDASL